MNLMSRILLGLLDALLAVLVVPAALYLKAIRRLGVFRLRLSKGALMWIGVFPIRDHYYEPMFNSAHLRKPLDQPRPLPGIDLNVDEQLALLRSLVYGHELADIPGEPGHGDAFHFNNGAFESGDAEFLYNLIRLKKPKRLFEIGSGNSTLMAIRAIRRNQQDAPDYRCHHLCVEPYEMPWLERSGVEVIRRRVEDLEVGMFRQLGAGDILFIDSSHVIRPQGDVLFEYLELLPTLNVGVIVHVHDIFTPRDYLREWVVDQVKMWNEQYLLEAFLTGNRDWKVIGALNYLTHDHFDDMKKACPYLEKGREPGSFYIERVR